LPPNFHNPNNKIGIFISNINVPVSIPVIRLIIMATPVTPPGAREFGSRKQLIAKEINQTKKYQANRLLVENIYSLNKLIGKEHSVADLANAFKSGAYKDNPDADKLMKEIGKEFIRQEQVRAIAP